MVDDRWRREPTVVVLGRANVGKSTLVNRIVGRREAVVEARPGVTRDRKELTADWAGRSFRLIDTGGWVRGGDELDAKVAAQSEAAMAAADVALVVVDATTGVTDEDVRVARATQRLDVDTLVVVNKVDGDSREALVWEFLELGLGEPVGVSALHGRGTGDLLDAVVARFGSDGPARDGDAGDAPGAGALDDGGDGIGSGGPVVDDHGVEVACSVAVVGRPNVGKSTLFNRLIGEDRAVVHDQPGTTRDSVDTVAETSLGAVRFVDTAGMRRRSRIGAGAEYYSMVRALDSVDRADVALLVIDATDGVTHQDQRLAERIDAAGCPVMVLLNKWDLLDAEGRDDVLAQMARRLAFIGDAVVLRVSALTGKGVGRLLPALEDAIGAYRTRIPTRQVNDAIGAAQAAQPAPGGARVLYATQGAADPPTFTLFSNRELPATYLRYLEHHLQDTFSLGATPIKLRVRRRSD